MNTDAQPSTLMPLTEILLLTVFHRQIKMPDAEAGLNRLAEIVGGDATPHAWHAAVAEAVAAGLMHDPVRLPPGALQCHWHLELTLAGTSVAWRMRLCQSVDQGHFHESI
jgi:hypothetical protein